MLSPETQQEFSQPVDVIRPAFETYLASPDEVAEMAFSQMMTNNPKDNNNEYTYFEKNIGDKHNKWKATLSGPSIGKVALLTLDESPNIQWRFENDPKTGHTVRTFEFGNARKNRPQIMRPDSYLRSRALDQKERDYLELFLSGYMQFSPDEITNKLTGLNRKDAKIAEFKRKISVRAMPEVQLLNLRAAMPLSQPKPKNKRNNTIIRNRQPRGRR